MRSNSIRLAIWSRLLPTLGLIGLTVFPFVLIPINPATVPANGNLVQLTIVSSAAIMAIVAIGTAMFVSLSGLPSVAHAGLWGMAAYASAIAIDRLDVNFWAGFLFALVVPALIALPVALVALRTRGAAFLIVTIAMSEFLVLVLYNGKDFTGGRAGIAFIEDPPALGPLEFVTPVQQYYLYLAFLVLAASSYWLVRRSRFGVRNTAIRDNEDLARSLSLNATLHRVLLFEYSIVVTGLAGPLILLQQRVITPDLFTTTQFIDIYLMIMLGGAATIAGPILGAWIVQLMPQWIAGFGSVDPNVQQLIYGALLLVFVLAARQGLIGAVQQAHAYVAEKLGRGGSSATDQDEAAGEPNGPEAESSVGAEMAEVGRGGDVFRSSAARPLQEKVVLKTTSLSHNFGANKVLVDLDFELRAEEIRGLVGPNGSGKTTLLNCVSGFIDAAEGSIQFQERELRGRRLDKVSSLGVVRTFQQPEVFPSFTPRQTIDMVLRSVGAVGGGRAANPALPQTVEFYLDICALTQVADASSSVLSYGQTRLLGVAAALARRPFVLLLDEPAAGLSGNDRARLADVVRAARDLGVAIVIVDHDMPFLLPLCDRLTVFDYGRKLAEGDPQAVCQEPQVIAAYLGSAFAERHAGLASNRGGEQA